MQNNAFNPACKDVDRSDMEWPIYEVSVTFDAACGREAP